MNTACKAALNWILLGSAAAGLGAGPAGAQGASPAAAPSTTPAPAGAGNPGKSNALIDAGEPRADTSAAVAAPDPAPAAGALAVTSGATRAAQPGTAAPHPLASSRAPKAAGEKAPGAADRLDLSTATVTGDREQPKVMYIVPWKKADLGDLSGKPLNSLLDEALTPVDRDEFRREVAYYDALKAVPPQNGASNAAAQGEK
jgi:hypothetical protein